MLVVMDVAECYEIVDGVPAFVLVMLPVVEFEHFPGIVWGKHAPMPTASFALEPIALQNRYPNGIGN